MTAEDKTILGPPNDLPSGDLKFFNEYLPSLPAGNWRIDVEHSLVCETQAFNGGPFTSAQEFVVSAPQVAIDPSTIINRYPPANSAARYGEVLPHIVLSDPTLPWERAMGDAIGSAVRTPWLALLVLTEAEIVGAEQSATRTQTAKVVDFLSKDPVVLKPSIVREDDVADSDSCVFITLPVTVFQAVAPRFGDLAFLAHCRQANTIDKPVGCLDERGLCSVVVANRFTRVAPNEMAPPVKNYVHLVSMEGWGKRLSPNVDFDGRSQVALLSLASWSFQSQADSKEDFRGLAGGLVESEAKGSDGLWLRLTHSTIDGNDAASMEARSRLAEGFTPLPLRLRTGEESFGWYRGPFAPVLPTPLVKTGPFLTADAALVYQKAFGVFDASLAAAWEVGRGAALSDRVFARRLLDFRRRAHGVTDRLLDRLKSDHFGADDIAAVEPDALIQKELLELLSADFIGGIGTGAGKAGGSSPALVVPVHSAKAEIQTFLKEPGVIAALSALVAEDLKPVAEWLGRLLLLYSVPFPNLVPDERMLPPESLRFFYVDSNWTSAMLDGAISVGTESSRTSFFHEMIHGAVEEAAYEAAHALRNTLFGVEPTQAQIDVRLVSGFLLRSALVSGWPTLAVRPCLADGSALKILRLERLSPNVLLCLIGGIPDYVDLAEPQEGFRFGVDDDGLVSLRAPLNPESPGGLLLGTQLNAAKPVPLFDPSGATALCTRAPEGGVLAIDPLLQNGVVAKLTEALAAAIGRPLPNFGSGDLALQMVKAPETIRFTSRTTMDPVRNDL